MAFPRKVAPTKGRRQRHRPARELADRRDERGQREFAEFPAVADVFPTLRHNLRDAPRHRDRRRDEDEETDDVDGREDDGRRRRRDVRQERVDAIVVGGAGAAAAAHDGPWGLTGA